jgi:RNA polymerase sigma-70 factor (ECF subfamily)
LKKVKLIDLLLVTNEEEILCRLAKGDRQAFDAVYRQYFYAVYCNALKITREVSAAEDVLQDVFIALWQKKETIDTDRSLGSWLFVVCYNKSVNFLKKKLRESLAQQQMQQVAVDNGEEAIYYNLQWEMLEEAMAQLSPQKRKVFELCKLQGKTYEETAATLHISKHTVKEYLSAAVSFVKEYVHQHPQSSVAITTGLVLMATVL